MATTTATATETTPSIITLQEKSSPTAMPNHCPISAKFSWESHPMPLLTTPSFETGASDPFTHVASEMALVHNCIIRALNSIYLQAPHISITEYTNFVQYFLATYQGLVAHHDGKEQTFFPEIERLTSKEGLMDDNIDGHREFDSKLSEWGRWIESCAAGKNNFSPDLCMSMMDSFLPALHAHLAAEIPSLLALSRFPDLEHQILRIMKAEGEKVMGEMSKTTQLPVFMLNHDTTFEDSRHSFPPVPGPVRWLLRSVYGRWNAEWWKFSTVVFDGIPRKLRFLRKSGDE